MSNSGKPLTLNISSGVAASTLQANVIPSGLPDLIGMAPLGRHVSARLVVAGSKSISNREWTLVWAIEGDLLALLRSKSAYESVKQ